MRFYQNINSIRNMNVKVICDDNVIYEGNVENAPEDVGKMLYYDIKLGSTTELYTTKKEII